MSGARPVLPHEMVIREMCLVGMRGENAISAMHFL